MALVMVEMANAEIVAARARTVAMAAANAMAMAVVIATSEVETKVTLMGHPGLSCHVPVVRSIFIILIPKYHLEIFVRFTLLGMYYHSTNFLIITL